MLNKKSFFSPRQLAISMCVCIGCFFVTMPQASARARLISPNSALESITFDLQPNPQVVNCFAQFPNDTSQKPIAHVKVSRGAIADKMTISVANIRPNLKFNVFTVQRGNLNSDGSVNSHFKNFGLAWYQGELFVNSLGKGSVKIKTILLDQNFGFDPLVKLKPTQTLNVGFWFDDPSEAASCGFVGITPFSEDHEAGPVAMISLPDPVTNLGPLCTDPNTETDPATCNP